MSAGPSDLEIYRARSTTDGVVMESSGIECLDLGHLSSTAADQWTEIRRYGIYCVCLNFELGFRIAVG